MTDFGIAVCRAKMGKIGADEWIQVFSRIPLMICR